MISVTGTLSLKPKGFLMFLEGITRQKGGGIVRKIRNICG